MNRSKSLSYWIDIRVHFNSVFNNSRVNAWHLLVWPCKIISKFTKKSTLIIKFQWRTRFANKNVLYNIRLGWNVNRNHFFNIWQISLRFDCVNENSMMIGEEWREYYHHRSHLPYDIKDYSNVLNQPSVIDCNQFVLENLASMDKH